VVYTSSQTQTRLHKRHTDLLCPEILVAVAENIITLFHNKGESNSAEIVSKHWGYSEIGAFLTWCGHKNAIYG